MHQSGLYEFLENIYAYNTIEHILMGKAVLRAVRGHMIVDCVLRILIISNILGLNLQETDTEDKENNDQIDETKTQMEDVDAPMKAKFDRV